MPRLRLSRVHDGEVPPRLVDGEVDVPLSFNV